MFCIKNNEKNESVVILSPEAGVKISGASVESVVNARAKTKRYSAKRDLYTHSLRSGFKMTESGRSMIEMLGVLAIIGVLSVGGIAGYSKAMMKYKVNKTIEQITHTAAAIKTAYMQQPETHVDEYDGTVGKYYELNSPTAIAIGAVSDEMISESGNSLQNVFGGIVYTGGVFASEDDNILGTGFAIDYRGVPKEACIALATYDWTGVFQGLSIQKIKDMPNYAVILNDAAHCSDDSWYYSQEGYAWVAQGCKSNPINRVTLSPADAALGCTCEDNLCDIAFVTND